jgi:hypothetical protein
MKKHFVAAAVIALSSPSMAQDKLMQVTPDALTWNENPAFPKGVKIATLVGDLAKAGDVVVLREQCVPLRLRVIAWSNRHRCMLPL